MSVPCPIFACSAASACWRASRSASCRLSRSHVVGGFALARLQVLDALAQRVERLLLAREVGVLLRELVFDVAQRIRFRRTERRDLLRQSREALVELGQRGAGAFAPRLRDPQRLLGLGDSLLALGQRPFRAFHGRFQRAAFPNAPPLRRAPPIRARPALRSARRPQRCAPSAIAASCADSAAERLVGLRRPAARCASRESRAKESCCSSRVTSAFAP